MLNLKLLLNDQTIVIIWGERRNEEEGGKGGKPLYLQNPIIENNDFFLMGDKANGAEKCEGWFIVYLMDFMQ